MTICVYTDGSSKGWVCALIHSGEDYFKAYFKRYDRPFPQDVVDNFELQAIIFALEKLPEMGEEVRLYSDSITAINVIKEDGFGNDVQRHMCQHARRIIKSKGLNIDFNWVSRKDNLAGFIIERL